MTGAAPERLATRDLEEAREVTLRVPADHACFEGHFPGRPIVPGVVLLHWAATELARWRGVAHEIEALEALKFRRPVAPGETLVLRLAPAGGENAFTFSMADDHGPISSGRLRVRM